MSAKLEMYQSWIEKQQYVCVHFLTKEEGCKSMYGKILKIDCENEQILFYDDDHKRVECKSFSVIDDIQITK